MLAKYGISYKKDRLIHKENENSTVKFQYMISRIYVQAFTNTCEKNIFLLKAAITSYTPFEIAF